MNHHRRDVLSLRIDIGRHVHPQLGQHALDTLHGERRLGDLVTTAVEANHQPVTHQLIATNALDLRDIFDPLSQRKRRQESQRTATDPSHHFFEVFHLRYTSLIRTASTGS